MRCAGILVAAAGLLGCDKIVSLKERPPVDAALACDVPPTPPGLDTDGDGIVNELDACPLFPNQANNDEDGDGVFDDCDLCPQVAGDAAGDDPDCDGIGAACDPASDVLHDRVFYGLSTTGGLDISNDTTLVNGVGQMVLDSATNTTSSIVASPVPIEGTYETQMTVRGALVPVLAHWVIYFEQGGTEIAVGVYKLVDNAMVFRIQRTRPTPITQLVTPAGLPMASDPMTFRIRVVVTGTGIEGYLTLAGETTVLATDQTLSGVVTYAVEGERNSGPSTPTTVGVDYLSRITTR